MKQAKTGARSPYRKYHKREFLYSKEYQEWARKFRPIKQSQIDGRNNSTRE